MILASREIHMEVNMDGLFVNAKQVADDFGVSVNHAYKMIRLMNEELSSQGYLTVAGRVSRKYYLERIYGGVDIERMNENASLQR